LARKHKRTYALSRRNRAVVISFCLTMAALLIGLDRGVTGPRWSRFRSSRQGMISSDLARYDRRTFPVVRVVDGDTLHLDAPDGGGRVTKVRLLGVDAPEMSNAQEKPMYFAEEATRFARDLALGKTVTVYLDQQAGSRDKYDRLLAYIALPDQRFLNEELLLGGYAYTDLRFRHSYYYRYKQLEASARAIKAGLWAGVSAEQMPPWRQRTAPDAE
jgi:endonuclease YncB( thermonuclease family)